VSNHVHGVADDDDGLIHYVHWSSNEYARHGGHWNGVTWCSYELTPDTPSGIFIRCHNQRKLDGTIITCVRCAARDPKDRRPWG